TSDNSDEQNIPIGSRLTSINDSPVEVIQNNIVQYHSRDGDNPGYPRHLFFQFFPAYYSYFYGFQKTFQIGFEDKDGNRQTAIIQGLPRDKIKAHRANKQPHTLSNKGISLKLDPANQLAVIRIRSFDKDILKTEYQQRFKPEIKNAF